MGWGLIQSIGWEIACQFSQDHTMVTKFLEFVHPHPISSYFFTILTGFSKIQPRPIGDYDFMESKIKKISIFSNSLKKNPLILFQI
jgi:hypothetical protein